MVEIKTFDNGFEYIEVANQNAKAKIALQGAHLFSYETFKEHLWVSKLSCLKKGKAIRGGVPICWPWFGKKEGQNQHGFARDSMWEMVDAKDGADTTIVTLKLIDTKDYECELYATFEIGKELKMYLKTLNVGEDELKITQALHTYFSISDIKNISISGLENKPYLDQLDATKKVQNSNITIDKEVDRIYLDVDKPIVLNDSDAKTKITTKNSSSCIVWNPWIEKAKSMGDMDDDGYEKFVCIESANALDDFVVLKEGQTHTLSVSIKVV